MPDKLDMIGGLTRVSGTAAVLAVSEGSSKMQNNGEHQKLDRLIRFPELEEIFGQCRRSIRRKSKRQELPALVRSVRVVGMLESDVKEHFQRLRERGHN